MPSDPRLERLKFTLLDATLLIAASSIGFVFYRTAVGARNILVPFQFLVSSPERAWDAQAVIERAATLASLILTFVGGWVLVLPVIRLRVPRQSWRRASRQPGTIACIAVLVGIACGSCIVAGTLLIAWTTTPGRLRIAPDDWLRFFLRDQLIAGAGLAVANVWIVQILSRRWRPEPDWIDRLGRALGGLWIFSGFIWACRVYFRLF